MEKRNVVVPFWLSMGLLLSVMACASGPRPEALQAPLLKLTAKVQAEVRYPDSNAPIADEALVPTALREAPELEKTFRGIPIRVLHNDKNVVLLVLSPDGKHAWLEDESSTPKLDKPWYRLPPEFTLTPSEK